MTKLCFLSLLTAKAEFYQVLSNPSFVKFCQSFVKRVFEENVKKLASSVDSLPFDDPDPLVLHNINFLLLR